VAEVKVDLGNDSYSILIEPGSIASLGLSLKERGFNGKVLIISDHNVGALYGDLVVRTLEKAGFCAEIYCVQPGEDTKSLEIANLLYTKAIALGLDRKSLIVALGGGVVGDLAGFIAATYLRGVPFVQVPTSLLAQVDSSVGGKVAVNHELGKNLIGAFYQPKLVLIDTNMLNSLPERELYTGLAEVIKYGLIADRSFYDYLHSNHRQILDRNAEALTVVIQRSCEIKARVVEQDEHESSLRVILNFGHTIAHAIEAATGYGNYNHGEAVAIGMHGAALISCYCGLCEKQVVDDIRSTIAKFNLPLTVQGCTVDELLGLLQRDKKTVGGKINWVLLNDIGKVTVHNDIPEAVVRKVLTEIS